MDHPTWATVVSTLAVVSSDFVIDVRRLSNTPVSGIVKTAAFDFLLGTSSRSRSSLSLNRTHQKLIYKLSTRPEATQRWFMQCAESHESACVLDQKLTVMADLSVEVYPTIPTSGPLS